MLKFLILFIHTSAITFCQDLMISKKDYYQALKVANILMEGHDVNSTLYLGLGRSPSLITETMRNQGYKNVLNLPLSSFRYNPKYENLNLNDSHKFSIKEITKENIIILDKLSNYNENKLYKYFDDFFSTNNIHLSYFKKIVIFDYAESGASLFAASSYFNKYLKYKNLNPELRINALASKSEKTRLRKNADFYNIKSFQFIQHSNKKLKISQYDDWAEYEEFNILKDKYPIKNPRYLQLKNQVRSRKLELDKSAPNTLSKIRCSIYLMLGKLEI